MRKSTIEIESKFVLVNVPSKAVVSFTQFLHFASLRLNSPFTPDKSKLVTGAMSEAFLDTVVNRLVVEWNRRDIRIGIIYYIVDVVAAEEFVFYLSLHLYEWTFEFVGIQ